MTVSAQTPINRSTGNGATTVFPYAFKIISAADIEVTVDDVLQTLNVDYTVSGAGVDAGGNVTMTTAPANLTTVVRRRNMALVRTTDYQDQGALPAATLDLDIDATVLMVQQLDERLDRTFSLPASFSGDSTLPAPAPGYLLGWDATGENLTNIAAQTGTSLVDLSASGGSALVGFTQSGTGAVSTTVQAKLRESVSVKDFGAVGDGVADDTAAIQAAIDSIGKLGTVFFPKGVYKITNTLNIIYTAVWQAVNLIGVGNAAMIEWAGGNNKPMIHMRGPGTNGSGFYAKPYIEKLQLYGNAFTGDAYTNVTGIQIGDTPQNVFSGVCNFTIRDCLIRHTTIGISVFYESDEGTIDNNYIERFTAYGVYNQEGGSGVWITKNHISDGAPSSVGIYTSLSSGAVEKNIIQGAQISVGILVAGLTSFIGKAVSIRNNYIESQTGGDYAIALYGTDTAIIENNTINGFPGATLILLADNADGTPCRNVELGINRHTQSGGLIAALANASVNSVNCRITGYQQTDGAVNTIIGPFQQTQDLNEYIPGDFTATLFFGATQQTTVAFTSYTKIGRAVYINGTISMIGAVSGAGGATIQGLPFGVPATIAYSGPMTLSCANVSSSGQFSATTVPSTSTIQLWETVAGGTRNPLTHANFAANSEITFSGFYLV